MIQGQDAVKIGVTSDLEGRLSTLQTGSPHPLSLAYSTRVTGDAYAVEAEAHAILGRHRLSGEWFSVPPDVAVAAINGAAFRLGAGGKDHEAARASWLARFIWSVVLGMPFWWLALIGAPAIAVLYLCVPLTLLIIFAMRAGGPGGDNVLWLLVAALGTLAAGIPVAIASQVLS